MINTFELWPVALWIVVGILGLLVGSFLNVAVYRLPIMMERAWQRETSTTADEATGEEHFNLWWPPSACPHCHERIKPWQNIPVISFLVLRARCADCHQPISWRYPLVELLSGALSVAVAYHFGPTWALVAALVFTWMLLTLALIDIDHQLLPDSLTLPLLWVGLLLAAIPRHAIFVDLHSAVIGAAAGYLVLWLVYHAFKLLTHKEGMGYGDFKLLAALGAWLGWQLLPVVILLSAAVGALLGAIMLLAAGKSRQTPIPFGPYLAAAGWITLLFGHDIMAWYVQFLR